MAGLFSVTLNIMEITENAPPRAASRVTWLNGNARPKFPHESKKLGTKKGGTADDEFEFGEEELKELEEPLLPPQKQLQPKAPAIRVRDSIQVDDVLVTPIDRISEFKRKIYLATSIPPYRQHLWVTGDPRPLAYRISNEYQNNLPINITQIYEDATTIFNGLPVTNWIEFKESIQIDARDEFTLVGEQYDFCVVDMEDFIGPIHANIESMLRDTYSIEMIYWGFVVKFWPMLTLSIFSEYITSTSLEESYPLLSPPLNEIRASCKEELRILSKPVPEIDVSKGPPSVGGAPFYVSILRSEITCSAPTTKPTKVHLRNLFDVLTLTPDMQYACAHVNHNGRAIMLEKSYKSYTPPAGARRPRPGFIFIHLGKSAILIISERGTYAIESVWREDMRMDFAHVFEAVSAVVNPLLTLLFDAATSKLIATQPLPLMTTSNSRFSGVNASLFWKFPISIRDSSRIINAFMSAGFFVKSGSTASNLAATTTLEFNFLKGMTHYDIGRLWAGGTMNTYSHMFDAAARMRYDSVLRRKHMTIAHRFSDLRIDITGLREQEFSHFMDIMLRLVASLPHVRAKDESGARKLRQLKEKDPVLYELKKMYGIDDDSYGRKCQQPKQPIMYHEPGKGRVKYWNFTTNEPVYYGCPNPKYPHIMFRTDIHPSGYCVPCCYKLPPPSDPRDKKTEIYNKCLTDHVYNSSRKTLTQRSAYIVSYGKDIEVGRFSHLPEETLEPLFFNASERMDRECADRDGYYLFGVPQNVSNVSGIGALFAISHALGKTIVNYAKEIIELAKARPAAWSTLLGGRIELHFTTLELLLSELNAVFVGTTQSDWEHWNQLWLDMTQLWYDVHIAHFRDGGGRDNISLIVPPDIRHWEEYVSKLPYLVLMERDGTWNPVYAVDKKHEKITRLHKSPSSIVTEINNIVRYSLPGAERCLFDLHMISVFVRGAAKYAINRLYINGANRCYAIDLKRAGPKQQAFYLPIVESHYELEETPLTYDAPTKSVEPTWAQLEEFIKSFNAFVASYAVTNNLQDSATVRPLHWVSWGPGGNVCGFKTESLLFLFKTAPMPAQPEIPTQRLLYDPFVVNTALAASEEPQEDSRTQKLYPALYELHLYELLVVHFSEILQRPENAALLEQLRAMPYAQLIKKVAGLIKHSIKPVDVAPSPESFPNVLLPCSDGSAGYCSDEKLIVTRDRLDNMIEILAADIQNPLKARMWIPMFAIIDYFKFTQRKDESITIEFS